jgi:P27 family predicted phage terminase small subunit
MAHRAPNGLKASGQRFWRDVMDEFELSDPQDLELLKQACGCLDRLTEAQEQIEADGMFTTCGHGGKKSHPALTIEASAIKLFLRITRELRLDVATADEGYSRSPRLSIHGPQRKKVGS